MEERGEWAKTEVKRRGGEGLQEERERRERDGGRKKDGLHTIREEMIRKKT